MTDDDEGGRPPGPTDPELLEAVREVDAESLPHQLPRNNRRSITLRLVISLAFLGLLFWRLPDVSIDDVLPEITSAAIGWVAIAIAVHIVAYVLQTGRWNAVSDTLGLHLPFRRMFS